MIETPISESGFVGAACAAAIEGLRPVVEFQFADFIACAFDQIVNYAAKAHYRWGTPVPVVFRGPSVGGFLTNPSVFGGITGTPILNQPQVGYSVWAPCANRPWSSRMPWPCGR